MCFANMNKFFQLKDIHTLQKIASEEFSVSVVYLLYCDSNIVGSLC